MIRPLALAIAAVSAPLLLGGCTTGGDFPSLAPRAIEREDPLTEPVRTAPVVASDPALVGRLRALRADALEGATAFEAEAGSAEAAARRAGTRGSDSWVEAQQALSRLEAARAPSTIALAELDALLVIRAAEPTSDQDFAMIRAILSEVELRAAEQQRRIDAIRGLISR